MGIGSALAVLRELNIHNLTRSTNHAGEKQTNKKKRMKEGSPFFLSCISSVCVRETKGMRLA